MITIGKGNWHKKISYTLKECLEIIVHRNKREDKRSLPSVLNQITANLVSRFIYNYILPNKQNNCLFFLFFKNGSFISKYANEICWTRLYSTHTYVSGGICQVFRRILALYIYITGQRRKPKQKCKKRKYFKYDSGNTWKMAR